MGLWPDMIRCASRGAVALGPAAREAEVFLRGRLAGEGGFQNRGGQADLYYTAFAMSALRALEAPPPASAAGYLDSFAEGAGLDLIHLSCLARSWECLGEALRARSASRSVPQAIRRWRSGGGGFAQEPEAPHGTVYGAFLALGACQDCGAACPDEEEIARSVLACRASGGGFSNSPGESDGLAPVTAGAVAVLHSLSRPVEPQWGHWLIDNCFRGGGFVAHPLSPEPDLLSTAVSLHAVELCGLSLDGGQKRACAEFVRGLQAECGGFRGAASEEQADCEYTFYGLLAMGHLDDGASA